MSILSNYIDIGFGSSSIDYSVEPFNNIENIDYSSEGFGNYEELIFNNNAYKNQKSLSFSSKEIKLTKNLVKYQYEDIYEKGRVLIEKNNFKIVKLKNNNIINPVFVCTTNRSTVAADISLNIEKMSSSSFKIFNSSNKTITADYIATSTIIKKSKIEYKKNKINLLNKNIQKFIYS